MSSEVVSLALQQSTEASAESASGLYQVEAVATINKVVVAVEIDANCPPSAPVSQIYG